MNAQLVGNMPYLATLPSCQWYIRPFGTPSGGVTFKDWGPSHLTLTGSSGAVNSTNKLKFSPASIAIPGTADYVYANGQYGSFGTYNSPMSVSAWVYVTTLGTYTTICTSNHNGTTPSNGDWWFFVYSNALRFYRFTGSGFGIYLSVSTGLTFNTGQWNHVSVQWTNSGACTLELNGVTSSVSPTTNTASSSTVISGTTIGNNIDTSEGLQGYIDEVIAFSSAIPYSMFYPQTRRLIVG